MHARRLATCLALIATLVAPAPLLADEPDNSPTPSKTEAPATIEELTAQWQAKPESIARGVRLQDAYIKAGKRRVAEAFFRTHATQLPDSAAVSFLYGRIKGGKYGLKLMREALAKNLGRGAGDNSGLLSAWIAMTVAEADADNAKEAEAAGRRVATLRGRAEDWTYLGWIQERLVGSVDRAKVSYTRAVRVKSDHLRARNALTMIHAEAGETEEALSMARGSVAKHGRVASAQLHLGLVLAMSGDTKGAADAYGKALACAGNDADALAAIADAYIELEEQDLAYKALKKALAANATHGDALASMGALSMDMGDVSGAATHLKLAAKSLPKDPYVAFLQGVCMQRLGKDSTAIKHFRKAMELESDNVEYVTALALAHMKKGSIASAVTMLKRAVKMDPEDPELRLQLGIAYLKQRKHKAARDAFNDMVDRAPKDPRPFYYLAIIYGDKMGKHQDALNALEEYERLGGKEPTALSWLEDLRAQLGK